MNAKTLLALSSAVLLCSCGRLNPSSSSPLDPSSSEPAEPSSSATTPASSHTQTSTSLPEIDYVKVFCETKWTNVYAWYTDSQKIVGDWPGTNLSAYDQDWKTYDFIDVETPFNVIFNGGGKQTPDLHVTEPGYWWYYQDSWYRENPLVPETSSSEAPSSSSSSVTSSSSSETSETPPAPVTGLDNRHRTWYQLLVYSFADSNGDGIGDFKGIANHLDYLQNLGIGGLWLSPCHPSADYHGYDVKDYYSIDSKYEQGGMTFAQFLTACHNRGIKVLMDMVLNHTSDQHPWVSQHPDWYSGEHVFSGSMPDLNYDKQEVRTEIKKIGKYWLDKGVDGFRCDGAAWIYGGGGGWNVESDKFAKTVEWWTEYATYLKSVKSDVYLVGECWTDLQWVEQFYGSGMSAFNFSASYWAKDAMNNNAPAKWVEECVGHQKRVREKDSNAVEASFLSNHDTGRFASEMNEKKDLMLANALNVIAPGGSFVYYGDELGMTGDAGGWKDQSYRTPMPFESGRTNGESYMWRNASSTTKSGKSADADARDSSSMYSSLAKVIKFKNDNPALYSAKATQVSAGNNAVGVMKYATADGDFYLVLNSTGSSRSVAITGEFEKAFAFDSNGEVTIAEDTVTLPSRSFVIVKASEALSFQA